MKRLPLLSCCLVLAITFAWLVGCSTNSTESVVKVVGDTTSAEFQTASQAFDLTDEVDGIIIDGTFELMGSLLPPATPREPLTASAGDPVFHEASMYWYRVDNATETTFVVGHPDSIDNIAEWVRTDSLQFLHSGTPVMIPDPALLSEIKAGVQLDGHDLMSGDSVHATRHLQIAGVPGSLAARSDVVVNAGGTTMAELSFSKSVRDTLAVCGVTLNLQSDWSNLEVNLASVQDSGKCPTAGTIAAAGSMNVACTRGNDNLTFNGAWAASQTFNGDQVTYVFENATTRWTITRTCGDHPMASPFKSANPFDGK